MTGNPWFRMYTDFLEDAKMMTLAFEDQRHFIGVLALKSAGTLDQDCEPRVMDRIVAQKLWLDGSVIVEVKRRLIEALLIDEDWQPLAWDKRQMRSDHDMTAAERQRRYREKQRNALRNVDVTPLEEKREEQNREEEKGSEPKRAARFQPPTLEEVTAYCRERRNSVNAAKFHAYYTSNGWKVGRTKMVSWKGAIHTWEQGENENGTRSRANGNGSVAKLKRIAAEDDSEELGGAAVSQDAPGLRAAVDGTYRRH